MNADKLVLFAPTEVGTLGVFQLKRLWSRALLTRRGQAPRGPSESHLDHLVLHALGLGIEQAIQFLFRQGPTFEAFEGWLVSTAGSPAPAQVARINAAVIGAPNPPETQERLAAVDAADPVLSPEDLAFWEEHGYVILHDAVPAESRDAAAVDRPESWYAENDHGIMVQLFQDPAQIANRASPRIHKAFAQLWGTSDLWVSADRLGFNPPVTDNWKFPGQKLHWDVSLVAPIPFGTQGILYLTDTPSEQGAFACVPGFHHRIEAWLKSLPRRADPRTQDLFKLGPYAIGGRAGDLIIWHQALPHGASPNTGKLPRLVQYINMYPTKIQVAEVWR